MTPSEESPFPSGGGDVTVSPLAGCLPTGPRDLQRLSSHNQYDTTKCTLIALCAVQTVTPWRFCRLEQSILQNLNCLLNVIIAATLTLIRDQEADKDGLGGHFHLYCCSCHWRCSHLERERAELGLCKHTPNVSDSIPCPTNGPQIARAGMAAELGGV